MGHDFLQTNLVDKNFYGICGDMGYQRYGLRGVYLYKEFRLCGNKGSENRQELAGAKN